MKNITEIWKQIANSKTITPEYVLGYCLLRALRAKHENKVEIARYFIGRAFSPTKRQYASFSTNHPAHHFHSVEVALRNIKDRYVRYGVQYTTLLGEKATDIFETAEEIDQFAELINNIGDFEYDRHYTYVFVRQDIPPVHQLVQAAHVTMCVGQKMGNRHDAHNTYFAVIGVLDKHELRAVHNLLVEQNFAFEEFVEPDIGHEVTAIATHPIHFTKRRPLQGFPLLVFDRTEVVA